MGEIAHFFSLMTWGETDFEYSVLIIKSAHRSMNNTETCIIRVDYWHTKKQKICIDETTVSYSCWLLVFQSFRD